MLKTSVSSEWLGVGTSENEIEPSQNIPLFLLSGLICNPGNLWAHVNKNIQLTPGSQEQLKKSEYSIVAQ